MRIQLIQHDQSVVGGLPPMAEYQYPIQSLIHRCRGQASLR